MTELAKTGQRIIPAGFLSIVDRRNRIAGIGMLLGLILYAFFVDPDKVTLFKCVFREWTGWNCLVCGLSHSLHASACFDWAAAFKYHLFGPVLFLSSLTLTGYWIIEIATNRKGVVRIQPGIVRGGIIVIAGVWLIYWMLNL